ncbi:MAG TPA: DNA-3-methyladenine glycosylase I [Candidatus Agrococcus pullicola]|uniref:DNA-3-methyladenine glycosylase I n=1 Tax=Candidatus Agrococcus pullicola TaxID=2838429 RepID=A0A9D2CAU2_9MICO|nr:DNA-3-methyladenine glycosylase I [Candidatus Agrococcus pullicola]
MSTAQTDDGRTRPAWASASPLLREYYDNEWGVPVTDERGVFERISLEVFQSGLSWATILAKRDAFRMRFHDFDPDAVATWSEREISAAMQDAAIVRNERKIRATVANAQATVGLRSDGGLAALVWSHIPTSTPVPSSAEDAPTVSPESIALAKRLKSLGFKHVGPTTMFALMEAIGLVDTHPVDSHRRGCSGLWNEDGSARHGSPARLALPGE